jgi:DNA ligase-1
MRSRLDGVRVEHVLNFGERHDFTWEQTRFHLTLLPAGHIFGSAMSLIEAGGISLLYTGDFKLRHGLSAEPCAPRPADILIMETTFGRPQYVFPPTVEVMEGVKRFCREALDNDETPVLVGYSLGKSQEILCALASAGLPLMLHATIARTTEIYREFGHCFPPYERYEGGSAAGKVLICPPNSAHSALLRKLGKTRSAVLTGWAVDPHCRFRYQCDAAFPLSDHADFPDLLELVRLVAPKRVYTLHGFAADFAQTLRDRGYDARALSESEQFALSLGDVPKRRPAPVISHPANPPEARPPSERDAKSSFHAFAECCGVIRENSGKLEKIRLLAEYLRPLNPDSLESVVPWFSGRPFPAAQNKVMQVGWAVLRDALAAAADVEVAAFQQVYLRHSDVGETAQELLAARNVAPGLRLEEVQRLFEELHAARGPLGKRPLLTRALAACSPQEAKYLVKIITGDLRIGLKEGLVEEAIAVAFNVEPTAVRKATLLTGDVAATATLAAQARLGDATLIPFRPVKFMLASPEETAQDIWERLVVEPARSQARSDGTKETAATDTLESSPANPARESPSLPSSVWIEDKYDGVRCQAHKAGGRVGLYSRDLKDITQTFPEIAEALRDAESDFVLDGEIVAMRGEAVLPFSDLQRRLGRREGDLFMGEEVPICLVGFDLLWADGVTLLETPLKARRAALEQLPRMPKSFRLAHFQTADSAEQIELAFDAARARGNEGLMVKDPESPYAPGRRGLWWLKLKKALATLDCVVVGAEYGHGKRSQVLSDYTFAVRDENSGALKVIGKAYSGLTDVEIAELTRHFLANATRQRGRYFEVPPDTVLEIAFDKLQPSSRHDSGLAMRFPRIVRIRRDKSAAEIDTLASARKIAAKSQPEQTALPPTAPVPSV